MKTRSGRSSETAVPKRRHRRDCLAALALVLAWPQLSFAVGAPPPGCFELGNGGGTIVETGNVTTLPAPNCFVTTPDTYCETPELAGLSVGLVGSTLTIEAQVVFPGNHQNDPAWIGNQSYAITEVFRGGNLEIVCPLATVPTFRDDTATVTYTRSFSCSDANAYTVVLEGCPLINSCKKVVSASAWVQWELGCILATPPVSGCQDNGGSGGQACCVGPGSSSPPVGGLGPTPLLGSNDVPTGAAIRPERASPPGVDLAYQAGGAGSHESFPGTVAWRAPLGRGWSHAFAMRIVEDPDPGHVWLITPAGTFRELTDSEPDGLQTIVASSRRSPAAGPSPSSTARSTASTPMESGSPRSTASVTARAGRTTVATS